MNYVPLYVKSDYSILIISLPYIEETLKHF